MKAARTSSFDEGCHTLTCVRKSPKSRMLSTSSGREETISEDLKGVNSILGKASERRTCSQMCSSKLFYRNLEYDKFCRKQARCLQNRYEEHGCTFGRQKERKIVKMVAAGYAYPPKPTSSVTRRFLCLHVLNMRTQSSVGVRTARGNGKKDSSSVSGGGLGESYSSGNAEECVTQAAHLRIEVVTIPVSCHP